MLGRRLSEATAERPTLLREAGLTALQVWDALGQSAGRIPVKADLTIAFTDLVDFSKWSLLAGDEAAVALLREVSVRDRAAGHGAHGQGRQAPRATG